MNAGGRHPALVVGTCAGPSCWLAGVGAGIRRAEPGAAGPVLGPPPSQGTVCARIRSFWAPEKQIQGHAPEGPLNCHWQRLEDGILRQGGLWEAGTVASGALGQDSTHRGVFREVPTLPMPAPPSPAACPLLGSQRPQTPHRQVPLQLLCSESDTCLPPLATLTMTLVCPLQLSSVGPPDLRMTLRTCTHCSWSGLLGGTTWLVSAPTL